MSTRLYGNVQLQSKGKNSGHQTYDTPSFSFSFKPELGTPANGYTSLTYVNKNGEEVTKEYNKYSGMMYSPPGKGRAASASFSFGNNLEAKVRNDDDSTGVATEKIKLIEPTLISVVFFTIFWPILSSYPTFNQCFHHSIWKACIQRQYDP